MPMESNLLSRADSTLGLPLLGLRGAAARWEAEDEKRKPFPTRYRVAKDSLTRDLIERSRGTKATAPAAERKCVTLWEGGICDGNQWKRHIRVRPA